MVYSSLNKTGNLEKGIESVHGGVCLETYAL